MKSPPKRLGWLFVDTPLFSMQIYYSDSFHGGGAMIVIDFFYFLFFLSPWYTVPKGGAIKQSKSIKAAGMTTCPVHRPRKNSHAV